MAKIFISYAHEESRVAEAINLTLGAEGYEVFFDKDRLPVGTTFHKKIRDELTSADLIIFLLSDNFFKPGSYTLTELRLAKGIFPQASGKVLPVLLSPLEPDSVGPYLAGVTWLIPEGLVEAEVAAEAQRLLSMNKELHVNAAQGEAKPERGRGFLVSLVEVGRLLLLSVAGAFLGMLLSPITFIFLGGFAMPILLAITFGLCAWIGGAGFDTGVDLGIAVGIFGWFCGYSAHFAAYTVRGKDSENQLRDNLIGALSGASAGVLAAFIIANVKTGTGLLRPLMIGGVRGLILGAVLGAVFGILGSFYNPD